MKKPDKIARQRRARLENAMGRKYRNQNSKFSLQKKAILRMYGYKVDQLRFWSYKNLMKDGYLPACLMSPDDPRYNY